MTPGILPIPPSTSMHRIMTDSINVNDSGLTNPWKLAYRPPLMPPNEAPMAKASSFTLRVLMPMAAAATSSSRIATQARALGRRAQQHTEQRRHQRTQRQHDPERQVQAEMRRG